MSTTYKYGIDFGTTNSSIAIVEPSILGKRSPKVFPVDYNHQPHEIIKSVVGFKDGEEIVGDDGMFSLHGDEDNPVREVKMKLIGNGKDAPIPNVPGKDYSDAVAAILRKLKTMADVELSKTRIVPNGVVIGLPCEINSNNTVKSAYKRALVKAGFFNNPKEADAGTQFLDEPCAVALYYGNKALFHNKRVFVYDAGGGTNDFAIVDIKPQKLDNERDQDAHKVLNKSSMYGAGGRFTEILFKDVFFSAYKDKYCNGDAWTLAKMFRRMGCKSTRSDDIFAELCNNAGACWKFIYNLEIVKAKLSFEEYCDFQVDCETEDGGETVVFERVTLTRKAFEEALKPEIARIEQNINRLLTETEIENKGFKRNSIDSVILAGGSSSIPCIRRMIEKMFPGKVSFASEKTGPYYVNMMTCIAQGLAVQGYYDSPSKTIDNITKYTYGFWDDYSKSVHVVIPKNTRYSETYTDLSRDGILKSTMYSIEIEQVNKNASSFHVDIYEEDKRILTLRFDKYRHSGTYRIFFSIDPNTGILEVKVYDIEAQKWVDDLSRDERMFEISEN